MGGRPLGSTMYLGCLEGPVASKFPHKPASSWVLPADAASIVGNGVPSPFSVCDGICEGGRERERDRIRGWWPREIMWIFYHQINSTSLNYQRASHHSLFSRGQGKLFIIQHEMK